MPVIQQWCVTQQFSFTILIASILYAVTISESHDGYANWVAEKHWVAALVYSLWAAKHTETVNGMEGR